MSSYIAILILRHLMKDVNQVIRYTGLGVRTFRLRVEIKLGELLEELLEYI